MCVSLVRALVDGILTLILVGLIAGQSWGLGQEAFGPAGDHISTSSDWPQGAESLLRHPSRVYWQWVNGNEHSYYDGDVQQVNELLALFAQMDLVSHRVVFRPGRPSARSFQGDLTPYNVEFELPSGIYMWHARQHATTGLYCSIPRLIVHVGDDWVADLGKLKIPPQVKLLPLPYRVEDALAQIGAADRSLRGRAISILGQASDAPAAVIQALKRAAGDEDEYIRQTAQDALASIEHANMPEKQSLRRRVAEFLNAHPQLLRDVTPQELLETLRETDRKYAGGITVKGTLVQPTGSGLGQLTAWTVTMGGDRLVIQQQAVDDERRPPRAGQLEDTIYVSPDRMAMIHRSRVWAEGKLIDTKPHTTFEPVGSTYDLLIGRLLWPLGRGFSRRIDRITEVRREADGTLEARGESEGNLGLRWELKIDPSADQLVRQAKAFRRDQIEPSYIVDNAGVFIGDDLAVAHTARWVEGALAHPVSISVTSVIAKPDINLVHAVEDVLIESQAESR